MRAIGASKSNKPGSALVLYRTHLDAERAFINVPVHIPLAERTERRHLRSKEEAGLLDVHEEAMLVVTRMLDLLRDRLHPTAYRARRRRRRRRPRRSLRCWPPTGRGHLKRHWRSRRPL